MLVSIKSNVTVYSSCFSLIISYIEDILVCLMNIHISSLMKYLLNVLPQFWTILFLFSFSVLYIFCIQVLCQIFVLQIFSPSLWFFFHFLNWVFQKAQVLKFDEVQFIYFYSLVNDFSFLLKNVCLPNKFTKIFFYVFFQMFQVLDLCLSLWLTLYWFLFVEWYTALFFFI